MTTGGMALYRQALEVLVQLQIAGTQGFSPEWCFDTPFYDASLVRQRECHYFVQAFLQGYLGLETTPEELTEDFELLLQRALHPEQRFFLHRDFQSRNLMVHHNRLWLIDFQGARLGPLQYDLAALLLDPYVNLPFTTQEILLTEYLGLLQEHLPLDPVALAAAIQLCGSVSESANSGGVWLLEPSEGQNLFSAIHSGRLPEFGTSAGMFTGKRFAGAQACGGAGRHHGAAAGAD